jgi:murein peptide amidase A
MKILALFLFIFSFQIGIEAKSEGVDGQSYCLETLSKLPGPFQKDELKGACEKVKTYDSCQSVNHKPIFHYDKAGEKPNSAKKILVISLIHGDEVPSGAVSRAWMNRLDRIAPRNSWRLIPIANPDGLNARTRTNFNKVDVNRNFPSKDWSKLAAAQWKSSTKEDPRKYPGPEPESEPETRCLVKHINDFKPDFIISIHTPLGILDFDGPKVKGPDFKPLPWVRWGNFPGSLGRYMWVDKKVPVLTIELKGNSGVDKLEQFDRLQDISGTIAIQVDQIEKSQRNRK